jgi:hypothetical protein
MISMPSERRRARNLLLWLASTSLIAVAVLLAPPGRLPFPPGSAYSTRREMVDLVPF